MTTIVAVRKGGAVAIGADTLHKDGSTMQRAGLFVSHSKIIRVGESLLASCGASVWGRVLASYFSRLKEPADLSSAEGAFHTVLKMHSVLKKRYGLNADSGRNDQFESSRLTMLVVNPWGAFTVYADRCVDEIARFYAFGSGYEFALGAMHAVYDKLERPEDIARVGVEAAAEFDEDTGLPAEVHRVELAAGAGNGAEKNRPEGGRP